MKQCRTSRKPFVDAMTVPMCTVASGFRASIAEVCLDILLGSPKHETWPRNGWGH
jgi:hypothetical protein